MSAKPPRVSIRPAAGEGPDVVLLHGFGADRWTWMANQAAIGTAGRPVLVDLPGHGAAAADIDAAELPALAEAVLEALDGAGIERFHLVGHSLGGGVALHMAAEHPERVASLALIAPVGLGGPVDAAFLEGFAELAEPDAAETLLRSLVVRPRLINQQLVSHVLDTLEAPGRRDALRRIAAGLNAGRAGAHAAAQAIAATELPRLTVWGEADRINPLDRSRLESFGGGSLLLAETGHLPHVEAAPRFNRALTEFLARSRGD